MAVRFIIKMLYGLERRFRCLQITRHSRRLPRKESTAMLPNMLENNIAFKLLSTVFLRNDVSLAFDKLFQVISLSVFFSTPISAEDEKHKPLKLCTIKKPVANVCLSQCLPFGNRCDLICNCFQRIFLQSIRIYVYMVILSENSF